MLEREKHRQAELYGAKTCAAQPRVDRELACTYDSKVVLVRVVHVASGELHPAQHYLNGQWSDRKD